VEMRPGHRHQAMRDMAPPAVPNPVRPPAAKITAQDQSRTALAGVPSIPNAARSNSK
jgi:hypothetical protein